jgi:hypothetical protein
VPRDRPRRNAPGGLAAEFHEGVVGDGVKKLTRSLSGSTFKPTAVNEFGDIGVAVGGGLIDDAMGAEVEDGVHVLVVLGYCRADPNGLGRRGRQPVPETVDGCMSVVV